MWCGYWFVLPVGECFPRFILGFKLCVSNVSKIGILVTVCLSFKCCFFVAETVYVKFLHGVRVISSVCDVHYANSVSQFTFVIMQQKFTSHVKSNLLAESQIYFLWTLLVTPGFCHCTCDTYITGPLVKH